MNEKIVPLFKLQELDAELDGLLTAADRLGPEREAVRALLAERQAFFESSKKAYVDAQVLKKNLELDIEAKDQAARKSGSELNSVKSNEAYKALLSQMEEAKKAKTALEDQVLELMERMDQLQKESKESEKSFQQDKAAFEKKTAELEAEEARLRAAADEKKKARDEFASGLPADLAQRYEQIRRGRRGAKALASVASGICGGCRMTLAASVLNEVMKTGDLVSCESCSRILYIPPKTDAPVPSPETPQPAPGV
ncbi:MAG: zinc ribbon domain-containing protein [Elusimicrobiota bacterium]